MTPRFVAYVRIGRRSGLLVAVLDPDQDGAGHPHDEAGPAEEHRDEEDLQ
jgi:hypothetical protein